MRSRVPSALRSLSAVIVAGIPCLACGPPTPVPAGSAKILAEKPLYSSRNEEILIRSFFNDRRDGFFLDVGCYLPVRSSNTYYLEKHLNWSGIAVDALAEFAPAWKEQRPRSRFFAFLVSDHSDSVESFYRSALPDSSSTNKERVARRRKRSKAVPFDELQVPAITLTELLDDSGVSRIDFLSLDIEGGEPLALDGFDIDRFRPELVCLEVNWKTRERVQAYFSAHRYYLIERYLPLDTDNQYYARKDRRSLPD
jgi:FkbM family methyltransferase